MNLINEYHDERDNDDDDYNLNNKSALSFVSSTRIHQENEKSQFGKKKKESAILNPHKAKLSQQYTTAEIKNKEDDEI